MKASGAKGSRETDSLDYGKLNQARICFLCNALFEGFLFLGLLSFLKDFPILFQRPSERWLSFYEAPLVFLKAVVGSPVLFTCLFQVKGRKTDTFWGARVLGERVFGLWETQQGRQLSPGEDFTLHTV